MAAVWRSGAREAAFSKDEDGTCAHRVRNSDRMRCCLGRLSYELWSFCSASKVKWVVAVCLQALIATISFTELDMTHTLDPHAVGDVWAYPFLGVVEWQGGDEDYVGFPILWIAFHAFLLYLLADRLTEGMSGFGTQALIRSDGRRSWVARALLAQLVVVFAFYLQYTLVVLAVSLVAGEPQQLLAFGEAEPGYLLLPLAMSGALALVQACMSLLVSPALAFAAALGVLLASVYVKAPLLLGNYGMYLRLRILRSDGFGLAQSALACGAACVLAALLCGWRVRTIDVVDKDVSDRWK